MVFTPTSTENFTARVETAASSSSVMSILPTLLAYKVLSVGLNISAPSQTQIVELVMLMSLFLSTVGVNQNYGDTATLSNYCLAKIGVICTRYNGCVKPCNADEVGEGALPPYCTINGDDWT